MSVRQLIYIPVLKLGTGYGFLDLQRTWKQIINLNSDKPKNKETIPGTKVFVPERAKRYVLDEDEELIIDERGVRLARSEPEGDD